jgi:hypothetical protein
LGWPISYGTIITYTEITREIASNLLTSYQPKEIVKTKTTEEITKELAKK